MHVEQAEQSRRLLAISETTEVVPLRAAVMDALSLWGIEAAYFIAPITADPRVGRLLTNIGLPRVWERHYRARLHRVDPLPTLSLSQSGAFAWPEACESVDIDRRGRRYLEIAARYGQERGVGVACYGPHGRSGFLGAAWPFDSTPPIEVQQSVHMIGQTSFQRYCKIMPAQVEVTPLSNRELEVLSWMCEGKSNNVIAQILAISSSSVDAYARRIFSKLDVTDRTTACLRGYSMGLVLGGHHQQLVSAAGKRDDQSTI